MKLEFIVYSISTVHCIDSKDTPHIISEYSINPCLIKFPFRNTSKFILMNTFWGLLKWLTSYASLVWCFLAGLYIMLGFRFMHIIIFVSIGLVFQSSLNQFSVRMVSLMSWMIWLHISVFSLPSSLKINLFHSLHIFHRKNHSESFHALFRIVF